VNPKAATGEPVNWPAQRPPGKGRLEGPVTVTEMLGRWSRRRRLLAAASSLARYWMARAQPADHRTPLRDQPNSAFPTHSKIRVICAPSESNVGPCQGTLVRAPCAICQVGNQTVAGGVEM